MRSALSAGLIAVGLLVSGGVSAAGFDCNLASTKVEKQICANPEISNLDYELNKVYKAVSSIDGVKQGQREWVKNVRNQTPNDSIMLIVYNQRIVELKGLIKPVEPVKIEPIKVEPVEVVAEPIKVEPKKAKTTFKEMLRHTEYADAMAIAKICENKDLLEFDYDFLRKSYLDDIKEEMKDRYNPEAMRIVYKKRMTAQTDLFAADPASLLMACHDLNMRIEGQAEETKADEMEF